MEFKAVSRVLFWIMVLSFIGTIACALPVGPYVAECCLQLANMTARPVSEWSVEDWEKVMNSTKCCDMSDRVKESTCSNTAIPTEERDRKAVESSDCCMLLDALMRRPQAEWTFRERLHYRMWNECCAEHMLYKQYESITNASSNDCCKYLKTLECKSPEDRSLRDRRSYNAGIKCCLENLPYKEKNLTPSFIARTLSGCCTPLRNLFFNSTYQVIARDEETFVSKESREKFKPDDGCKDGSNCCPPPVRDHEQVYEASDEHEIHATCCRLVRLLWQEPEEDLSPEDKASVLFWTECCKGTNLKGNQQVFYSNRGVSDNNPANFSN